MIARAETRKTPLALSGFWGKVEASGIWGVGMRVLGLRRRGYWSLGIGILGFRHQVLGFRH